MLEALKRLNGGTIHLPSRIKDRPDRDRLALRFERFNEHGFDDFVEGLCAKFYAAPSLVTLADWIEKRRWGRP